MGVLGASGLRAPPAKAARILAAVLLVYLTGLLNTPAPAQAQAGAPGGQEAFTELSSCIGNSKHLLVLLLIDESGSLQQTDPTAQRVAAAEIALAGLQALAQSSDAKVEVQLAGFSVDYRPVNGWTSLTPSSLNGLKGTLATFRDRNRGVDTDYYIALRGAQRQLAQRAGQLSAEAPCKTLLWFTDGEYDIDPGARGGVTKDYAPQIRLGTQDGARQLKAEGQRLLCGQPALVDELRRDDVPIFAVVLSSAVMPIKPENIDFLRAITSGPSGSQSCGTGGGPKTGATIDAGDVGEMLADFDSAASKIGRGTADGGPDQTPVCAASACPEGRRTFALDGTLRRFHLLARTDTAGIQVLLAGPAGGPPLTLSFDQSPSGSGKVGPVPVRWSWVTPQALTIDADRPDPSAGWDGTWTVTFVDPQGRRDVVARSQIHLFGDLVPELVSPKELHVGKDNTLVVQIVSELDGRPPGGPVNTRLEVTAAAAPDGPPTTLTVTGPGPDGRFQATWRPDKGFRSAEAAVTLRLQVTTGTGLVLAPAVRSVTLPVVVAGYPSVSLASARLGAVDNKGSTTALVNITGDDRVAGCVWLDGSAANAPSSAGTIAVSVDPPAANQQNCFPVAAGATGQLRVKIDPAGSANGTLKGSLRLAATSRTETEPLVRTLDYSSPLTRPVSQAKRFGLLALLVVLGVGLPILFAYLSGWWSARFQPLELVSSAMVPVEANGQVRRAEGAASGGGLALRLADFDEPVLAASRRPRLFEHRGHELHARMSKSPVGPARGEVSRPDTYAGATKGSLHAGRAGKVNLALPGQWIVSLPEGIPPTGAAPATLLAFARLDATEADLHRMSAEIDRELPGVLDGLRKRAGEAAELAQNGPDGPDGPPWTGGPSGTEVPNGKPDTPPKPWDV